MLSSNKAYHYMRYKGQRFESLERMICHHAKGVWLWVDLVTKDLLRDLRDLESHEHLEARIKSYPTEIDGIYRRILANMDDFHWKQTAQIILTTLVARGRLPLLALPLLLEGRFPEDVFQIKTGWTNDSSEHFFDGSANKSLHRAMCEDTPDIWQRRLQSRCRDFMKLKSEPFSIIQYGLTNTQLSSRCNGGKNKTASGILLYSVEFVHRTAADFFRDKYMAELKEGATQNFDPLFLCHLNVIELKIGDAGGRVGLEVFKKRFSKA